MVANESKLKDAAVRANAQLEKNVNALKKDLASTRSGASAELEQMKALVANLRAKIDTTTKEKNDVEEKLRANNELTANLKNELEQQTAKVKQMEAASAKVATSQIRVQSVAAPVEPTAPETLESVTKTKQSQKTNTQETTSGRGFAKKATGRSQQTSQSGQGFAKDSKKIVADLEPPVEAVKPSTPEQAEAERKARLQAAEEARKLNESKRVTAALDQLAKSSSQEQDAAPKQQSKATEKQSAKVYVGTKVSFLFVSLFTFILVQYSI